MAENYIRLLRTSAFSIAIAIISIAAFAQGPKELKASSARPLQVFPLDSSMTISLPDFFKQGQAEANGSVQFQPKENRNNGILIFVTRVGDANSLRNRYMELTHDLKRHEDEKITSKNLTKNSYTVWSDLRDDDKLDKHGEEQELIWYAHGVETPSGVYEIGIRFQPEYRKAITSILPKIISSFYSSPNS